MIDFQEGCRGITLVSAIHTCREELPIIVLTSTDKYHDRRAGLCQWRRRLSGETDDAGRDRDSD